MHGNQNAEQVSQELWRKLRDEAHAMSEHEPFLAQVLDQILFAATSLPEALARRLASVLAGTEVGEQACRALLLEGAECVSVAAALDLIAIRQRDPACRTHLHAFLNYRAFHAVQLHRVAHGFWSSGRHELAAWLSNRVSVSLGPDIHPAASIGMGVMLDHGSGIVIGETAVVENDVTIMQNVTLGGTGKELGDRHPKVRQGVFIGAGATIIGNIEVGAFSKIGAGSVVLKDVPPRCTVAGVPAGIVRVHPENEYGDDTIGLVPDVLPEASPVADVGYQPFHLGSFSDIASAPFLARRPK
jgi:serine O-acetyltransferase